MLILYNILQIVVLIVVGPLLFVKVILTPKYRGRIAKRLSFGLDYLKPRLARRQPRFWIHALSVGEVLSSQALVKGLRQGFPEATLVFSATTRSGEGLSRKMLAEHVDVFVPFPLDFLPCVRRIINLVSPDLFILVETDFWPNILHEMRKRKVPCLLVNGRISLESFKRYKTFRPFFLPLFSSFSRLSMQTRTDVEKMVSLGVPSDRVSALGNLKYESLLPSHADAQASPTRQDFGISEQALLIVAGSTHPGEEEKIFPVFKRLRESFSNLELVIAPRNVDRGEALVSLAGQHGLSARRRSRPLHNDGPVLILDTLGELAKVYALCDAAFVGGSLVKEGGHNPLEPAFYGKPVIFGPHMEDFEEIAADLSLRGAAESVSSDLALHDALKKLLSDKSLRQERGRMAMQLVQENQGVTARHLELIETILHEGKNHG